MKGNVQFPGEVTGNKDAIVFHIHKLWVKNPCERNTCTWRVLRESISSFFPKTPSTSFFIFPFSYYYKNSTPLTHPECYEAHGSGCKSSEVPWEWWENALLRRRILLRAGKKYYGSRALLYASEGDQALPPQNATLWHNDYFELKANEQGMDFPLWKWHISICKGVLSHSRKRRMTHHQRQPEFAL